MKLKTIFKTKLQVFAGIAWLIALTALAFLTYDELVLAQKTSANAEDVKDIVVTMLQMAALTTGICLFAWGIPFFPGIGFRIATGCHLNKPFKIYDDKPKKRNGRVIKDQNPKTEHESPTRPVER